MKHNYILLFAFLFCSLRANAGFDLSIYRVQSWSTTPYPGNILSPEVEITPKGIYAEVSITFTMATNSAYSFSSNDSLEAVLNFDLPTGSFIHDSWLWLDNTTVIRAAVVDRTKAQQIYQGYIRRRRDPSLLMKNSPTNYQLRVYPMTKTYPRKVRLFYSVPFDWRNGNAYVSLPTGIIRTSSAMIGMPVKVNVNSDFHSPTLLEMTMPAPVVTATDVHFVLPASAISGNESVTLAFKTNTNNGVFLGTYTLNPGESVYQLAIDPVQAWGNMYTPKNTVIILDHMVKWTFSPVVDIANVKSMLKTFMLKNYGPQDSFNIFHVYSNVKRAYTNWHSADSASIMSAIDNVAYNYNGNNTPPVDSLLKEGLKFAASKPGSNTQVIIFTLNAPYYNVVQMDTLFNKIQSYIGGSYPNKINVISNNSGSVQMGVNYLYDKMIQASGGSLNEYLVAKSKSNSLLCYTADIGDMLKRVAADQAFQTGAFNIDLPLTGFKYAGYSVSAKQFNLGSAYIETGKFVGTMMPAGQVEVQYLTPIGLFSLQQTTTAVQAGNDNYKKGWVNKYLIDLLSISPVMYKKEIFDSSRNNRVLCDSTAFLALETGDTIENITDVAALQQNPIGGMVMDEHYKNNIARAYPNPFTEKLTLEFKVDVEEVLIYDIMGRMIYRQKMNGEKTWTWNGSDSGGSTVPNGIYTVVVKAADAQATLKVIKQ